MPLVLTIGINTLLNSLKSTSDSQTSQTNQLPSGFAPPTWEMSPFGCDSPAAFSPSHTLSYCSDVPPGELNRTITFFILFRFFDLRVTLLKQQVSYFGGN